MILWSFFLALAAGGEDTIPTVHSGPLENRLIAKVIVQPGAAARLGCADDTPTAVHAVVSLFEIGVGETTRLTAMVTDTYGDPVEAAVTWSSSASSVATVDGDGLVTGQRETGSSAATVVGSDSGTWPSGTRKGQWLDKLTPNEPPGFIRLSERPFDAMREDGWGVHRRNTHGSIEQDADAPISPMNVYQMFYPKGESGGGGEKNRIGRTFAGVRELYLAFPWKVSPNWQGHSSGVNKMFFIRCNGDPVGVAVEIGGKGSEPLRGQVVTQSCLDSNKYRENVGSVEIIRGRWHHWEVLVRTNDAGSLHGELHIWIDGRKVMEYTNMAFKTTDEHLWTGINVDPIWGGTGDEVRQDMYQRVDHFYISGR